ncbi:MAG: protoporphyrinogen oxidase [Chloroflexota bacterium]
MVITQNNPEINSRQVVIIGGGIAGLSAAYYLQKEKHSHNLSLNIVLVEGDERLGGKIITNRVDDFIIEGGPDCFLRQKPWAKELATEIGLSDEIIGTQDQNRKVFVLDKGRLTPLPDGVMLIIPTRFTPFVTSPLISLPGKIRMGMDWFIPPQPTSEDESVADFVRRRLGKEALEKIAEPLLGGIHVSDPEKQSLLATFPRFRDLESKHGSLIRGMLAQRRNGHGSRSSSSGGSMFLSFRNGMSQFTERLEKAISEQCHIFLSNPAVKVTRYSGERYAIHLRNGEVLVADAIILAVPSYSAAALIKSLAPNTAALLEQIEYVSTATISLAFRKQDITRPFKGFGFVVPRKENRLISACTWTSFKFENRAPQEYLLLRCFAGGPGKEYLVDCDDESLFRIVREELRKIQGITAEPVLKRIYRWIKSNPQYHVGHLNHVQKLFESCAEELPNVVLAGSAYQGVGIPDCVHSGTTSAKLIFESLNGKE